MATPKCVTCSERLHCLIESAERFAAIKLGVLYVRQGLHRGLHQWPGLSRSQLVPTLYVSSATKAVRRYTEVAVLYLPASDGKCALPIVVMPCDSLSCSLKCMHFLSSNQHIDIARVEDYWSPHKAPRRFLSDSGLLLVGLTWQSKLCFSIVRKIRAWKCLRSSATDCRTRASTCSVPTPSFKQPYKMLARIQILSKLLRYTRICLNSRAAQIPVQRLLPTGEYSHNSETAGQN